MFFGRSDLVSLAWGKGGTFRLVCLRWGVGGVRFHAGPPIREQGLGEFWKLRGKVSRVLDSGIPAFHIFRAPPSYGRFTFGERTASRRVY